MVEVKRQWPHLSGTLFISSLVSIGLLMVRNILNLNNHYTFMIWNLFLAWIPLLLVMWLLRRLHRERWSSWPNIALSVLWLGFLPNSFYIVTDYIHLARIPTIDLVFDTVMLTSFVVTGLLLGFVSLYLFHCELRKRLPARTSNRFVGLILLLSSFAIYLGRDLRWNTWDLFLNPAGILFDVSDRLISPFRHPEMYLTTLSFFVLLGMFYIITWNVANAPRVRVSKTDLQD